MKQIILFILILQLTVKAQAQFSDDFSDGNFTANPVWTGDTSWFEVNSIFQLHMKSSGSDTSFLATASHAVINSEWDFWIKLSFNTSANNLARVYLTSDKQVLTGPLNGYYLQVGGPNDSVSLYRQTGNNHQLLFTGTQSFTGNSTNSIRFKITHDSSGTWHLASDIGGGTNFIEEGTGFDDNIINSSWSGIWCKYTSSNATKYYFDDFYCGPIIVDTLPPEVESADITDDHTISIMYSEIPEQVSASDPSHYYLETMGYAMTITKDSSDPKKYLVYFSNPFPDPFHDTLIIRKIKDPGGNETGEIKFPVSRYTVKAFDVVIDEIMADPSPQVGLPDAEYVELYNKTAYPIDLNNWCLETGVTRKIFPDVSINPHGFLILAKDDWLSFYGTVVHLFTSVSTLPNEGTALLLRNGQGRIIHSVDYTPDWFGDQGKVDGGWSLEMIDPDNPCGCSDNWKGSTGELGGTPGKENSVHDLNPDLTRPYICRSIMIDSRSVRIIFSEIMDSTFIPVPSEWNSGDETTRTDSISFESPGYVSLILHMATPFQSNRIYKIQTAGIMKDCAGNTLDTTKAVDAALPDTIKPGMVIINEILPDPAVGGERFLELFNRSDGVCDLKDLELATIDTLSSLIHDESRITEEQYPLFPGNYVVLTRNPSDIQKRYITSSPDNFIKMSSFPSLSNDHGVVALIKMNDQQVIDRMTYSAEMQFVLLSDKSGVSLERLSPERSSEEKTNWHSAAESAGFATPGYKNSEFTDYQTHDDFVAVSPPLFSPDSDGYEDVTSILLHPGFPGYVVNIGIYDARGRIIRQLIKNRLIAPEDSFSWDGTDDHKNRVPVGIYIISVEMVNPDGTVKHSKKTVVVGVHL